MNVNMNGIKVKAMVQKNCDKYDGAENLLKTIAINKKIEDNCSHEKLSVEEVIYFWLLAFYSIKVL